ncbi:MAG: hypothetical protein LBP22_07015 [Deltaproteobacteria bacterium]|jgi:hypothetical protein|nr:hypothetical protein [Deltaproteobacteria bacterium]
MPVELFLADLDGIKTLDEIYKKHLEAVKLISCDYLTLSLLFTLADQFDSHEYFNDLFAKTVGILSKITDRKLCEDFSQSIYFMSAPYFNSYLLNSLDRGGKMGRLTFDLHQMFNQSKMEVEARANKAEAEANKTEARERAKAFEAKYKELVQQDKALLKLLFLEVPASDKPGLKNKAGQVC